MKFINIITKHTQSQIDEILFNMLADDILYIEDVYSNFDFVEYTNDDGKECMFCIMSDSDIDILSKCYQKYGVRFRYVDLSKDVLFDNKFKTSFKNQYGFSAKLKISQLILKFKKLATTPDTILDKILEKGIESLTNFDRTILEKV